MSLTRLHNLYAVSLYTDAMGAAVILDGVVRQSAELGLETRGDPTSGYVYPRFVSIVNGKPMAKIGTQKLVQWLDTVGPSGLKIASTTNPGLKLFAYAHDDGGTRKSGANHRQYLIKKGLIVPRTLSVEGQGDAELDYEVLIVKDGSNDPIVESDSVTLPALSGDAERFGMGPVTLESVSIPQVKKVDIDFGISAQARTIDGDVFPTFASIDKIAPKVTLRGIDVEWLKSSNIPRSGKAITHTNTKIVLRKRAIDGTYVPDATVEHILVTVAGLAVVNTVFDAQTDAEGECSLEITTRHDGTNAPLVIDTTYAIA